MVDPNQKQRDDGKFNPTEYTSFVRRYIDMAIISWSPDCKYYINSNATSHLVSKSQFDSLFDAQVVTL